MIATRLIHASVLAAGLALAGCQQAGDGQAQETATPDTAAPASDAPPAPAPAADAPVAATGEADAAIQEGLRSQASLSGTAFATPESLEQGQAWQSSNSTELEQIRRKAEELTARSRAESERIRQRMAQRIPPEQLSTRSSGVNTGSPINIPITGDTIVVQNPVLARDVLALVHDAFVLHTGCNRIERIQIRNRTTAGPFNTTPDGRLSSGLIVERWTVYGCGKDDPIGVLLKPTPNGEMDIMISRG